MPRHPSVSATTSSLSRNVFDALARRARNRGGRVHRLNLGDTWREPLPAARAENQRVADHPLLHTYASPHGEPAFLDAVEARLARHGRVERDAIQVVSGATCGLSATCQALLDPGDEVLLPAPYWPLIRGLIASRGAVPVEVSLFTRLGEPGFDLEAALERAVTPRSAAIYLNTPHNPTGHVLGTDALAAIARVAARHDLWVLSDEVYEDIWYGAEAPEPPWTRDDLAPRTISTHSLSKTYGLAGARVGYTHGPAAAIAAIRAVHAHQVYCAPRPMQLGGARALNEGDEWLAETRRLYGQAAKTAADALGLPIPAGGTFLFFDASPWLDGGTDALPFLERCVDAGVLLTPGSASGAGFASWVRLCFSCVPPEELDAALSCLRTVLGR